MAGLDLANLRTALHDNYILVLTTNSVEKNAVNELLALKARVNVPFEAEASRLGLCADEFVLHLTGTSGGQADGSIGPMTRRLLNDAKMPRPALILIAGIGWGAPAHTAVGDVIVSGRLLAVNHVRSHPGRNEYRSVARESPLAAHTSELLVDLKPTLMANRIHDAPLASAERFVMDATVRDELLSQFPQVVGGEMEAWNLVGEVDGIPWLQVRGVSDHAEIGAGPDSQRVAARIAANAVAPLLQALRARGLREPRRTDDDSALLVSLLNGKTLQITAPSERMALNDHLNDRIGKPLQWRLSQYASPGPPPALSRVLADVLLEIAQNAIRHGGAKHAWITFNERSVVYEDDGCAYDTLSLRDGRGGARALATLRRAFLDSNRVALVADDARHPKINRYVFRFPQMEVRLKAAQENCTIAINYGIVREAFDHEAGREALMFEPDCEWLFFDAAALTMTSRRLEVTGGLKALLLENKALFIACADEYDQEFYQVELADHAGDRLQIFVKPD